MVSNKPGTFTTDNNPNSVKVECIHCKKEVGKPGIKKHEECCYLNPLNKVDCPVCNEPIKNYRTSQTCSYSCSNTYFRSGENNPNWREDSYQSTCFLHHGKKCIECGEELIVAAHHIDGNKENNDPENLVPLCPTHHQYIHSKYRSLIQPTIDTYIIGKYG